MPKKKFNVQKKILSIKIDKKEFKYQCVKITVAQLIWVCVSLMIELFPNQ